VSPSGLIMPGQPINGTHGIVALDREFHRRKLGGNLGVRNEKHAVLY
jgi:hypothetical protein